MKNTLPFTLKRTAGYLFGFALLYAPFELYRRFMEGVLDLHPGFLPHAFCPRIPTAEIFTGGFFDLNSVMVWSTVVFWLLCLVFGPFFCGRLCIAGYFTEALSHIMPDKYKIEWKKYAPVAHIRYGMLLAYMLLPLWYGFYPCAYCNFYFFDSLVSVIFGAALDFTRTVHGAVRSVHQRRARLLPLFVPAGRDAELLVLHRCKAGHCRKD